jgi:hypothetical protein
MEFWEDSQSEFTWALGLSRKDWLRSEVPDGMNIHSGLNMLILFTLWSYLIHASDDFLPREEEMCEENI